MVPVLACDTQRLRRNRLMPGVAKVSSYRNPRLRSSILDDPGASAPSHYPAAEHHTESERDRYEHRAGSRPNADEALTAFSQIGWSAAGRSSFGASTEDHYERSRARTLPLRWLIHTAVQKQAVHFVVMAKEQGAFLRRCHPHRYRSTQFRNSWRLRQAWSYVQAPIPATRFPNDQRQRSRSARYRCSGP